MVPVPLGSITLPQLSESASDTAQMQTDILSFMILLPGEASLKLGLSGHTGAAVATAPRVAEVLNGLRKRSMRRGLAASIRS